VSPWDKTLISIIARYGSGLPYTPATLGSSLDLPSGWWSNFDRKPIRWNVDLKLSQGFEVFGLDFLASLNIFNLLNHLDENGINPITGQAGPNVYIPEIGERKYERIDKLGLFTHDEVDYDPSWYSRPRFIQFGLSLNL